MEDETKPDVQSDETKAIDDIQQQPPLKKDRSKLYLVIFIIISTVAALGLYFWGQKIMNTSPVQSTNTATPPVVKKQISEDPELKKFLNSSTGEEWYAEAKPISSQGYFKSEHEKYYADQNLSKENLAESIKNSTPIYTEIGTHGDKTIILALSTYGIGDPNPYLFEKSSGGKVTAILLPSSYSKIDTQIRDSYTQMYADTVSAMDETTHYDSLSIPSKLLLENGESVVRPEYVSIGGGGSQPVEGVTKTKVADYGRNKLYKVERKYTDTGLTNIGYELQTVINTHAYLDYIPNTRSLEKYSWVNNVPAKGANYDGAVVFDDLAAIARGCGGLTSAVTRLDTLKKDQLIAVGQTDQGRAVYQPKDSNVSVVKKAYEEYVQWQRDGYQPSRQAVSKEEFLKQHGLVIIENNSKELLVYVRQLMAPSYGCAKPVVYLYPTKDTFVNVSVGADVKISEPLYPAGGWKNVLARPDGSLSYLGKDYRSLFWEGPGYGDYPNISKGTVVARDKVLSTMKQQLAQQGLNNKEMADFVEFWQPKIPNKPFVRLTWLSTAQMNQLAPLYVTPRPDTVIRVFLEMEGYDHKLDLKPQVLRAIPRQGFTLVEWGGLSQL